MLFAMDGVWWRHHWDEVQAYFRGERFSTSTRQLPGVTKSPTDSFQNSGAGAIAIAEWYGANQIVLIGYDCHRNGGVHWHGNHPPGLGNGGSMPQWPEQFARLSRALAGVEIINCSPGTALRAFPTMELEVALEGLRRTESEELRAAQAQPAHVAA